MIKTLGMSVKKELVYEFWDCAQCGSKGLLGSVETCSQCSKPRDKHIVFYRDSTNETLVSPEAAQRYQGGADWICEYCDGLNSSGKTHCGSCSAEKSTGAKTVLTAASVAAPLKSMPSPQAKARNSSRNGTRSKYRKWYFVGLAILCTAVLYWALAAEKNSYKVDQVSWTRKIHVERYVRESRESWDDAKSGEDLVVTQTTSKIRSYKDVLDHYKKESYSVAESYRSGSRQKCSTEYQSMGNGAAQKTTSCHDEPVYSTRQVQKTREVPVYRKEPIYDRWIRFQSNFYKDHQVFEASGSSNAPAWPKILLGKGFLDKPDRQGAKEESYRVTLRRLSTSKNAPHLVSITTTGQRFVEHYRIGQEISLQYQRLGGLKWPQGDQEIKGSDEKSAER